MNQVKSNRIAVVSVSQEQQRQQLQQQQQQQQEQLSPLKKAANQLYNAQQKNQPQQLQLTNGYIKMNGTATSAYDSSNSSNSPNSTSSVASSMDSSPSNTNTHILIPAVLINFLFKRIFMIIIKRRVYFFT